MSVSRVTTVFVHLQADAQIDKERQLFYDASLEYVFKIQDVQEKKKFEFVEPVRSFFCDAYNYLLYLDRKFVSNLKLHTKKVSAQT